MRSKTEIRDSGTRIYNLGGVVIANEEFQRHLT